VIDQERWRGWAAAFCGAALTGLAGCGGGGGGSTVGLGTSTSDAAAVGATGSTGTTESTGSTDTASATPSTPVAAAPSESVPASPNSAPIFGDCEMFPAAAIFNTRIDDTSRFPAHAKSQEWIDLVGRSVPFQADWGVDVDPANYSVYYGMPINIVDGTSATTEWPVVSFDFSTSGVFWDRGYPDKSDCAVSDGNGGFRIGRGCGSIEPSQRRFPFPLASKIVNEDGHCNDPRTCGDRHVLVVEKGACRLWESFFSYNLSGQWYTMATAAWDLKSLALRPDEWASGDAAGLPMTPLLAKAAEANSGEIRHALRVNFTDAKISTEHVWPARHGAGGANPGAIPFGALMRLRADFVIPDDWTTQAKALATAAKRYGMYVSDNGADFHVQGEPNAAWDSRTHAQMRSITMSHMEFVDLKAITSDPRFSNDSMAASW
jgi:hypothetical protein